MIEFKDMSITSITIIIVFKQQFVYSTSPAQGDFPAQGWNA